MTDLEENVLLVALSKIAGYSKFPCNHEIKVYEKEMKKLSNEALDAYGAYRDAHTGKE